MRADWVISTTCGYGYVSPQSGKRASLRIENPERLRRNDFGCQRWSCQAPEGQRS